MTDTNTLAPTDEETMTSKPTIEDCMEQAQIFASAWSLVGRGVFGTTMEQATAEKEALEGMLRAALAAPAQAVPAQAGEPWYGHKFKESQSGIWRCECGKTVKEATADWLNMSADELRNLRTETAAAPVEAQHSTACLYHYALSRLGLRDNTGLRVLFWDAHNSLSWDSKTDWYVTPDADKADCGQCNAAIAAQQGDAA